MKIIKKVKNRIRERKHRQIGAKISAFLSTALVTGMTTISASAADGATGQIVSKITELSSSAKTIAGAISVLMFICAGIAFMCGANGKQTGKGWLIGVGVGCLIVSVAAALASFFTLS